MGCGSLKTHESSRFKLKKASDEDFQIYKKTSQLSKRLKNILHLRYTEMIKEVIQYKDILSMMEYIKKEFEELNLQFIDDEIKNLLYYELANEELNKHSFKDEEIESKVFSQIFSNNIDSDNSQYDNDIEFGNKILINNIGRRIDLSCFTNEHIDKSEEEINGILSFIVKILRFNISFQRSTFLIFLNQKILRNQSLLMQLGDVLFNNNNLQNIAICIMNDDAEYIKSSKTLKNIINNEKSIGFVNKTESIYDNIGYLLEGISQKPLLNLGFMLVNDDILNISNEILSYITLQIQLYDIKSLGLCNFPFKSSQLDLLLSAIISKSTLTYLALQLPQCSEEVFNHCLNKVSTSKSLKFICLGLPSHIRNKKISKKIEEVLKINETIEKIVIDYLNIERLD